MRQEQIVKFSTPSKKIKSVSIKDFNKLVARVTELEATISKKEIEKPAKVTKKPAKE